MYKIVLLYFHVLCAVNQCFSFTFDRKELNNFSEAKNDSIHRQRHSDLDGVRSISNTSRYRLDGIPRTRFSFDPFSSLGEGKGKYCKRPARCEPLRYNWCMGTKLPYSETTLDLVDGLKSQDQAQEILDEWRKLIHIPKCWAVIQPFLCSLYMPKCDHDQVHLPSQEMCKMIMGPCRILATYEPWPSVFRCDNTTRYPPMCKNDVRELKFNTTSRCLAPLVQTDSPGWYYEGIEGCGVQCESPLFTEHERSQIHKLVAWGASLCALFNLFTIITFVIDWRFSSKYPALVIFYINFCFLMVCIGWLAQFLPAGRDDIVCRKDGTLRIAEPSAGENLSCVVVFVLVYYFMIAGLVWFVILTYAWHSSFQALGKIQECMEKKGAYFHLVAWSLPLVLTITTMALGEIDGNSVAGVCFVGYINKEYRAGFLLFPVLVALSIGTYFMSKGLLTLIKLKINSSDIISARASAKIRETILRMGVFSLMVLMFGITTFICHVYEFKNNDTWLVDFRKFILCKVGVAEPGHEGECRMNHRPSLAVYQLHILSLFCTGIVMSSWVWTQSTVLTWRRFIHRKMFNKELEGDVTRTKLKKHKVIAQAFAKRKMLNNDGRLSISIYSTHQDPVGLKFELNSGVSGSLSSTWAAALPKLVTRRGALVTATNSNSSYRRNSMDSDISYSVRRVSVESRRHSVDSAVSVKVSEVTQTLVKKVSAPRNRRGHRKSHHSTRKSGGAVYHAVSSGSSRRSRRHSRRHSKAAVAAAAAAVAGAVGNPASSHDSNQGLQQILAALAELPPKKSSGPNLGRRTASAGLEMGGFELLARAALGAAMDEDGSGSGSDSGSESDSGACGTGTNTGTADPGDLAPRHSDSLDEQTTRETPLLTNEDSAVRTETG